MKFLQAGIEHRVYAILIAVGAIGLASVGCAATGAWADVNTATDACTVRSSLADCARVLKSAEQYRLACAEHAADRFGSCAPPFPQRVASAAATALSAGAKLCERPKNSETSGGCLLIADTLIELDGRRRAVTGESAALITGEERQAKIIYRSVCSFREQAEDRACRSATYLEGRAANADPRRNPSMTTGSQVQPRSLRQYYQCVSDCEKHKGSYCSHSETARACGPSPTRQ